MAPALQIGRMDVPPDIDADFNAWYNTIYVPNYEKVPGVIRGRRYRAVVGHADVPHAATSSSTPTCPRARRGSPSATPRRRRRRSGRTCGMRPGSPGIYVKTFQLRS